MKSKKEDNLLTLTRLLYGKIDFIIPKQLFLLGYEWKVLIDENLKNNGEYLHEEKTVTLKTHEHTDRTFIHEVVHIRDNLFGWKIGVNKQDKEALVRLEAMFWLQFFKQMYPISALWRLVNGKKDDNLIKKYETEKNQIIKKQKIEIKSLKSQIKKLKLNLGGQNGKKTAK